MSILAFDDLHLAYRRGQEVLEGVTFALEQGEVVGLLGKNGAGKTSLIRVAMGMLAPRSGTVSVFGLDPRREPVAVKKRVGYVAEDQVLPPFMKVEQVIDLYRNLYPHWDVELARKLASRFAVDGGARIKTLSKGQARQVALLCAVSHRPDLLLLDEPAGGLDPAARREVLETAIELLSEAGTTILFSSHHMTDVERMASRLVMIHDGEKWIDSAVDEVREGYCLVLVPHDAGLDASQLLQIDGCLCVRDRSDALHAVFELEPEHCAATLRRRLDLRDARCTSLPLEEMFIELVGARS